MSTLAAVIAIAFAVPLFAEDPNFDKLLRDAQAAVRESREADANPLISEAWTAARKTALSDPDFAFHVKDLAELYSNLGRFTDTERLYTEATALIPSDESPLLRIQLLTALGWEYLDSERTVKSAAAFQRALDLIQHEFGPKSTEAGIGLGLRYIAEVTSGDFEKSDATLEQAISVEKSDGPLPRVFPVYNLETYDDFMKALAEIATDAYEERGLHDDAERVLRRAAALVTSLPINTQIRRKLISVLRDHGRVEEADHEHGELLRLLESSTSPEAAKTARDLRDELISRNKSKEKTGAESGKATVSMMRTSKDPWEKAVETAASALTEKKYEAAAAATKALLALVPERSRSEDRQRALSKIMEFAGQLAGTPGRDDRIVEYVASLVDVDFGKSPAIVKQLAEYYVKTVQSAKAYGLLDQWADAVRARAGSDAPELAKVFAYTADVKHREKDYRRALAVCSDWIESEQSARGPWSRRAADAYLKMAEISIDYEDLSAARSYVESGLHFVVQWWWMRVAEYSDRM
jgi:tetratricopeptide (TPR) repeat protein